MQAQAGEFTAKGLGLAGISYDSPAVLAEFGRRYGITFPLLSDEGSATIKAYGILNTVAYEALGAGKGDAALAADIGRYVSSLSPNAANLVKGTPFPGNFVIDRQRRVTSRFFEDYYRERDTAASILLRLGGGSPPVQATRISTAHAEITTYPSDREVAPGNRFSLVIAITPALNAHVYAPGAKGYRVVKVDIDPQPFVRVLPLHYPASEIYFFRPLNERVPVYRKPFTLLQEVVPEVSVEAEKALEQKKSLTFTGTLEYQACDDRECFNPASVPLLWTVALRKNITERIARPK